MVSQNETEEESNMIINKVIKKKNNYTKCFHRTCNKKLQLYEKEIVCKCKGYFCFAHRMPSAHMCSYNYKNEEEQIKNEKIIEDMKCVMDKVVKI
jgi:predicted nucleic acid binding AN1-type Zn finger protein